MRIHPQYKSVIRVMLTQRFKSFQLNGIQIGRIGRQEKQVKPRSSNENMRSSVKTSNIKMILLEFLTLSK
ncbi:uncharacterised protein [Saccharolobus solfataricus]|uniref:Uncharacterized protein n=1 Tax=Saccharolobus solfataricus TaxID=2287 RepID=A0A157T046_SACSO|nr:uncharacterised protein [Saccharolobus solfataricus]